jgi:hypothetical protein
MSLIRDLITSASVAAGNVASRERDREGLTAYEDGRPRPITDRARSRVQSMVQEGVAKLTVSQTAHFGAKELAKRLSNDTARKIFGQLAKRPAMAAGTAIFVFDTARDSYRFGRGRIDGPELVERLGGNAAGLVGAGAGAHVGAFIGTLAMPVIGTIAGSVLGGVAGGIGGDTYGRRKIRNLLGYEIVYEDVYEDEEDIESGDER